MTICDTNVVRCCWKKIGNQQGASIPSPRHGHRAIAIRHYILIFGGGNEGIMDDLYVFDTTNSKWLTPPVHGEIPSGCAAYGLVAVDNFRLLLFGGMQEYGKYSNELYELITKTWEWKRLKPKPPRIGAPPSPRIGHSFTLVGNRIFLFGGLANESEDPRLNVPKFLNDFYSLELRSISHNLAWDQPVTHGTPPSPRESHSAVAYQVMCPVTSSSGNVSRQWRLLIYGGMNGSRLGDVWRLDVDTMTWHEINTGGIPPSPRSLHSANIIGNKMFIYGGWIPAANAKKATLAPTNNAVHAHLMDSVHAGDTSSESPSSPQLGAAIGTHSPATSGVADTPEWAVSDELACLNLDTLTWETVRVDTSSNDGGQPRARGAHCGVVMPGSRLYIWSGRDGYAKMWNSQLGQKLWVCFTDMWLLETQRPPPPMNLRCLRATSDSLELVWSPTVCTDCYCLQISTGVSTSSPTSSAPVHSPATSLNKSSLTPSESAAPSDDKSSIVLNKNVNPSLASPARVVSNYSPLPSATGYRIVRPVVPTTQAVNVRTPTSAVRVRASLPNMSGTQTATTPGRIIRVLTPSSLTPSGSVGGMSGGNTMILRPGGSKVILQRPSGVIRPYSGSVPANIRVVSNIASVRMAIPQGSLNNANQSNNKAGNNSPSSSHLLPQLDGFPGDEVEVKKEEPDVEELLGESPTGEVVPIPSTVEEVAPPEADEIAKVDEKENTEGIDNAHIGTAEDDDDEDEDEDDAMDNDLEIHDAYWFDVGFTESTQFVVKSYHKSSTGHEENKSDNAASMQSLQPGRSYHFRVSACNSLGRGPWSTWATFRTLTQAEMTAELQQQQQQHDSQNVGLPRAPTGIEITKCEDGGACLTWDRVSDVADTSLVYTLYMASRKESDDALRSPQKVFLRLYQGHENRAFVSMAHLARAYIDQPTEKAAIIFRIAASNSVGAGPATQVRWLQTTTASSSEQGNLSSPSRKEDERSNLMKFDGLAKE